MKKIGYGVMRSKDNANFCETYFRRDKFEDKAKTSDKHGTDYVYHISKKGTT